MYVYLFSPVIGCGLKTQKCVLSHHHNKNVFVKGVLVMLL